MCGILLACSRQSVLRPFSPFSGLPKQARRKSATQGRLGWRLRKPEAAGIGRSWPPPWSSLLLDESCNQYNDNSDWLTGSQTLEAVDIKQRRPSFAAAPVTPAHSTCDLNPEQNSKANNFVRSSSVRSTSREQCQDHAQSRFGGARPVELAHRDPEPSAVRVRSASSSSAASIECARVCVQARK